MGRRISARIIVATLLFAGALYAPPVEAAGLSSIPATIGSYISDAFNFVAGFFDPPRPEPAAVGEATAPALADSSSDASPSSGDSAAPTTTAPIATSLPPTIIENTIYLPATTSPALAVSDTGFVSQANLGAALAALRTDLTSLIGAQTDAAVPESNGINEGDFAVKGILHVNGVTGLAAADIPDLSASYLSTKGGTVAGNLTVTGAFSGGALSLANASTTLLSVSGPAYFGSTATSTFGADGSLTLAKALGVDSGGTGWANINSGSILFGNGTIALATSSDLFWDNTDGRLGIGTTTPQYALTIAGSAYSDTLTAGSTNGVLVVGSIKYPTLASAVSACPATGCSIYVASAQTIPAITITKEIHLTFAPGQYSISGTITFQNVAGVVFEGAGSPISSGVGGTQFNWTGNSSDPMFSLQGVRSSEFGNFTIDASSGVPLATAIDIPRYSGGGITTSNNFDNIIINGTNGGVQYGFRLGEGSGNNQVDFQKFTHVEVDNYSVAAWSIEFSQAKLEQFIDCAMNSDGYGQYGITTALNGSSGGSFSWLNGGGGDNTVADFYLGSPDDSISINGGQFEGSARMLITGPASGNAWPITIQNVRWAGDQVAPDGMMIIYRHQGPLNLIGNMFGDGTSTVPLQINIQASNGIYANAYGNDIHTTLDNPFTGNAMWTSVGNEINTGPATLLPHSFAGSVGIGTTSPGTLLSLGDTGANTINISASATSTFGFGLNLRTGCYAISGTCLSAAGLGGLSGAGAAGEVAYYNGTNSLTSNSAFTFDGTKLTLTSGLLSLASTTIGNGTQTGGLTISGGATTTLNQYIGGILNIAGTSGTSTIAVGQGFTVAGSKLAVQQGSGSVLVNTTSNKDSAVQYQMVVQPGLGTGNGGLMVSNNQALSASGALIAGDNYRGNNGTYNSPTLYLNSNFVLSSSNNTYDSSIGTLVSYVQPGAANLTLVNQDSQFYNLGNNNTSGEYIANQSDMITQSGTTTKYTGFKSTGFFPAGTPQNTSVATFADFNASPINSISFNGSVGTRYGLLIDFDNTNTTHAYGIYQSSNTLTNYLAGNVGIGTTNPYSRLQITGPDTASTSAFAVVNSASTTAFAVYDTGYAVLAGTLTQNSDQRLKTNIATLDASSSLAEIEALNPVSYEWRNNIFGGGQQLGFIAQQVQEQFPQLVSTTSPTALTPGGTLGLNYSGLIAPIVGAIKALAAELSSLEVTVAGFAQSVTSDTVTATKQLCVGDVCVTRDQFLRMVEQSGQGSGTTAAAPTTDTSQTTTTPTTASTTPPTSDATTTDATTTTDAPVTDTTETTPATAVPSSTDSSSGSTASNTSSAPAPSTTSTDTTTGESSTAPAPSTADTSTAAGTTASPDQTTTTTPGPADTTTSP